jgi:hypothetical protein
MFSNIRKLVALALGATFSLGAPSLAHALPVDETNVLVIIDVTGSMMTDSGAVTPGGDVQTRLEVGRLSAIDWLVNNTGAFVSPEFAVWEFSRASNDPAIANFRVLHDFSTVKTQALAAVGASVQTSDSTPLAGTLCDAVDRLKTYENGKTMVDPSTGMTRAVRIERRIFLVTDGLENATLDTNDCWGPPATTNTVYPNYDFGSWQWKVLNKLKTGNANTPSTAPFEYIIDVEHILTSFITSLDPAAQAREAAFNEGLGARFQAGLVPYSTVEDDVNLLRGLSVQSGGVYTQLAPDPQGVVSFKIPGDADSNGCVDMTDYGIFASVYGSQVSMSVPATVQADFNHDGWVDDDDYMLLIQHWDEGC